MRGEVPRPRPTLRIDVRRRLDDGFSTQKTVYHTIAELAFGQEWQWPNGPARWTATAGLRCRAAEPTPAPAQRWARHGRQKRCRWPQKLPATQPPFSSSSAPSGTGEIGSVAKAKGIAKVLSTT